jgi:hypothetical protein
MIVVNWQGCGMELAVAYPKIPSWNFLGGTEENQETYRNIRPLGRGSNP